MVERSRRQVLRGISVLAGGSIAGCLGGADSSGEPTSSGSDASGDDGADATATPGGSGSTGSDTPTSGSTEHSEFATTQFRGDLRNTGHIDGTVPEDVELAWAVPTNEGEHSATKGSPVITQSGDILIADDTGRMRKIAPGGRVEWSTAFSDTTRGSHGTAAVADGTAYIGAYDGVVSALDIETGDILWQTKIGGAIGASPTYYDGQLYVAVEHTGPSGSVAVLDASTGALLSWDHRPTDHPHSTVAIDREQGILLCGSNDGYCYAWEFPSLDRAWRYDTGAEVKTAIAISDGTAIVPSWAETVTGIDISDGTRRWEFEADDMLMCAPAVQDGVAYVGSHDTNIYAIDIETGDLEWETTTGGLITGNAVATNDHVLVGSYDNYLYALDQADGSIVWSFEGQGEVTGAAAVTDDAVYFTERAKNGQSDYPGMLYKLRPA